jgi:rhodanese-related sulfurtransferase
MKRAALLSLFGVLAVFIACTNIQSADDVPRISKDELRAQLGSSGLVLLDVRTAGDWKKSGEKITGSVRMDPQTVDSWAGTLPKDKEIVLYCA